RRSSDLPARRRRHPGHPPHHRGRVRRDQPPGRPAAAVGPDERDRLMATGRLYQAALTVDVGIPEPSGRIYQAYAHTVDLPAPPTARIYQAHMSAAAGGVGVGRIYQAKVTATLPDTVVLSGIR